MFLFNNQIGFITHCLMKHELSGNQSRFGQNTFGLGFIDIDAGLRRWGLFSQDEADMECLRLCRKVPTEKGVGTCSDFVLRTLDAQEVFL